MAGLPGRTLTVAVVGEMRSAVTPGSGGGMTAPALPVEPPFPVDPAVPVLPPPPLVAAGLGLNEQARGRRQRSERNVFEVRGRVARNAIAVMYSLSPRAGSRKWTEISQYERKN